MLFEWNSIQTVHWESITLLNQREMKNLDILLNTFIKQFRYLWHKEQKTYLIFLNDIFSDGLSKYFSSSDEILLKPIYVTDVGVILRILLIVIIIIFLGILFIIIHSIADILNVTQILAMLLRAFVRSTNPLSTRTNAKTDCINLWKNMPNMSFSPSIALHNSLSAVLVLSLVQITN